MRKAGEHQRDETDGQQPVLEALVHVESLTACAGDGVGQQSLASSSGHVPAGSLRPVTISSIFSAVSISDGPKVKTIRQQRCRR